MEKKKLMGIFIPSVSFYLWIIFVLILIITVLNWLFAIPGYLMFVILVYHYFRSNYKRKREITKYIENLKFNIDTATKDTLLNFPLPLVLVELDGTIVWYNSSFKAILDGEELLEKTINHFVSDLHLDNHVNEASNFTKDISINNRYFSVLGNFVKVDAKNENEGLILLLYLIEKTELVETKEKYADEKASVGIFIIDNYDELMQSTEEPSRPQILAEIEKKISQWVSFAGAILKKYERDKYLLVFEHKYLKEFEEKKFEILDSVKEINEGNKIPVTLSLGFGINGETLAESSFFADVSIDIALGRGGDQVVIKDGDSFSFFGGKTRELEKRTKVKARVIAFALRELIDQSSNVIIMGHENADIDSLGGSLGLYRIAENRGKIVNIVLNNSNPTIDNIMSKLSKDNEYEGLFITTNEAALKIGSKTLLVVLDTHKPSFTESPELLDLAQQIVVIDHHRRGADFIQDAVLTYQETYASSTCELITEILQYVEERIKLKPVEAEGLYAGIVVDTKNFTFKTGVRTFEAASFLRRQGVDTISVKQLFQNDLHTYISISDVVKDAEIIDDSIAISSCPVNLKNSQLIAAQAADQLLTLSGLTAAFVLSYSNNEVFISGRSLGDINVQVILEKLGGGGHLTVAGAQLQGISMESAKEKLKYAIIEYIESLNKEG